MEPISADQPASASIERELQRVRDLTAGGRHREALAAAETLASTESASRDALWLTAVNQRCLNRICDAFATLERLQRQHPSFSRLHEERGECFAAMNDTVRAVDAFARAVAINPALESGWRMLERLYRSVGDTDNAAAAAGQVATLTRLPPEIVRAGSLFSDGELDAAENILRAYLHQSGRHIEALRLLARIGHRRNALDDAQRLLEAAVQLAPGYRAARADYARVLIDQQQYVRAREQIDALVALEPGNRDYLSLRAIVRAGLGEHESAIALYRELLAVAPDWAHLHLSLGHSLKAIGRRQQAIESYHAAASARPGFGDAYWGLANLKTYRFSDGEIERMRTHEAAPAVQAVDRYHLCFALGKALEDRGQYAASWQFYERGNALKRAHSRYRPEFSELNTRRQIEVCTAPFFAARAGAGVPDADPIFIVGLPRSGSTLIEQILASHSQVEGTQELYDIPRIVLQLQGHPPDPENPRYPGILAGLGPDDLRRMGQRYIDDTRAYRRGKPLFIDKMPNNFRHIGLIHLSMPNARIIDVRREPMACCFSNLKQLFASGQEFTYGIEAVARYYRTYLELMRHWDRVLPARVLRVHYEDVVEDLEANVRRILRHCNLDFEPACIDFHKTDRSVATASSEQVRQPIFREALCHWRNYEPWLDPLKDALGDALRRYREPQDRGPG